MFQATYDPSHGYSPQPIDISHMALSRDLQVCPYKFKLSVFFSFLTFTSVCSQWQSNLQKTIIIHGGVRRSWSCRPRVKYIYAWRNMDNKRLVFFLNASDWMFCWKVEEHTLFWFPMIHWQQKRRHETEKRPMSCSSSCSLMDMLSLGKIPDFFKCHSCFYIGEVDQLNRC